MKQEKKTRTQNRTFFLLSLSFAICFYFFGACVHAQQDESDSVSYSHDDLLLVEEVLRIEPGPLEEWGGTNSYVVFASEDVQLLASRGKSIVPSLVKIMEMPDIKFDTFVRCFLVCRTILENVKSTDSLDWTGGSKRVRRGAAGHWDFVFPPSMDPDCEEEFRLEVIDDIKKKLLPKKGANQSEK